MGKFLVRISVLFVAFYFVFASLVAQFLCVDILNDSYILLFELIAVVYSFEHGKYHCKFLRWTMLSIFATELISRLDNSLNFLSVSEHNASFIVLIGTGMGMTLYEAINHFYNVNKLKQKRAMLNERNTNSETTREHE